MVDSPGQDAHDESVPAQLNHHIVHARDPEASARFLSEMLGLPPPTRFGHFHVVQADNGVSLDFMGTDEEKYLVPNHYAFLVSDEEFDEMVVSGTGSSPTTPTRRASSRARSTTTSAAGASTGPIPTGTGWRSSPCPTAAGTVRPRPSNRPTGPAGPAPVRGPRAPPTMGCG